MRTIPEINHHLSPLEETLQNRFIPAITGGHTCNDTERKLVFTYSFGGLAIHIFYEQAEVEYRNSGNLTAQLTPLIKNQNKQYIADSNQNS